LSWKFSLDVDGVTVLSDLYLTEAIQAWWAITYSGDYAYPKHAETTAYLIERYILDFNPKEESSNRVNTKRPIKVYNMLEAAIKDLREEYH